MCPSYNELKVVFIGVVKCLYFVQAALDFAVAKDARVKLTCSYVEKFVHDNPLPQYLSRVCK